jgi:hypothetical protein
MLPRGHRVAACLAMGSECSWTASRRRRFGYTRLFIMMGPVQGMEQVVFVDHIARPGRLDDREGGGLGARGVEFRQPLGVDADVALGEGDRAPRAPRATPSPRGNRSIRVECSRSPCRAWP